MPRIRSIKPEFFTSLKVASLPLSSRLTFIGLWTYSDDEGRGRDDPRLVKAAVWPLDDEVRATDVEEDLDLLAEKGLIERYEVPGQGRFLQITGWKLHQKVNRPSVSTYPAPNEDSLNDPDTLTEDSLGERKGKERKGKEESSNETDGGFSEFWLAYPPRNGKKLEKSKALAVWRRLSKAKRAAAMAAVGNYAAGCGGYPKDAHRWLRDELWNDWQQPATPEPGEDLPKLKDAR